MLWDVVSLCQDVKSSSRQVVKSFGQGTAVFTALVVWWSVQLGLIRLCRFARDKGDGMWRLKPFQDWILSNFRSGNGNRIQFQLNRWSPKRCWFLRPRCRGDGKWFCNNRLPGLPSSLSLRWEGDSMSFFPSPLRCFSRTSASLRKQSCTSLHVPCETATCPMRLYHSASCKSQAEGGLNSLNFEYL